VDIGTLGVGRAPARVPPEMEYFLLDYGLMEQFELVTSKQGV